MCSLVCRCLDQVTPPAAYPSAKARGTDPTRALGLSGEAHRQQAELGKFHENPCKSMRPQRSEAVERRYAALDTDKAARRHKIRH